MSQGIVSKGKADAISNGVFLISLGVLFYLNAWWPGILLAVWAAIGLRQFLTGRKWDFIISTVILVGLFVVSFFNLKWSVLMPVLFVLGGIYIIFKEYAFSKDTNGEEKSEEIRDDTNNESDT